MSMALAIAATLPPGLVARTISASISSASTSLLTAVLVDDDPASSNNWSGFFGFENENTTRFEAKNIYVHKLN